MKIGKGRIPPILVEQSGGEGIRRIAGKVAGDMEKVFGHRPPVVTEESLAAVHASQLILCATLGKSPVLEELEQRGLTDTRELRREDGSAKWEVYRIQMISLREKPQILTFPREIQTVLLICGSDKRGTIYGMFALSEYIGVSPMCYWGDVQPAAREALEIGEEIETVSREPSIKYRGFFINDEWPCFGSWVTEHFGGFNQEAYDHVFELLLRLKGNYLWPAMWSASFPLDGPGNKNEELADLYGVVVGYSHHEPCLRASEEWDKVRGEGSRYGNEWNFHTNEQGLLHYWEDALKRSGKYEHIITIGMRGERDTSMLGPHSTIAENIGLLKDIITKQRELIHRYVERDREDVPMLLALYKEVEPYFYGDEETPGLKDWEGLEGVTCMFCEDNYGYMRTLPGEDIRNRSGGFGMYYHLDYHGSPISYEWVDSTPFSQIWEQMSEAYEYGIRDVWIVNVGDLKFHEVPLSYFMALAYDYDKWGYGNPDSCREYTRRWVKDTFQGTTPALRSGIEKVLTDYIRWNSLRRPEALHEGVYHPCHYGETDRMLERAGEVEALSKQIMEEMEDNRAYYSMIHYPAMASMNLLKMHLYAGKNHHYAAQGRKAANAYGELVQDCIRADRAFQEEWAQFRGGKWNGMQMAQHIGFTKWNEDDCRYPVMMKVEPGHRPAMSVSRKDREETATKNYGSPTVIKIPDFCYAGCEKTVLEIANTGRGSLHYQIMPYGHNHGENEADCRADGREELPKWLELSSREGDVEDLEEIVLVCHREKLPGERQDVSLLVTDGEARVLVEVSGQAAEKPLPMTFMGRNGIITMGAEHYCRKKDTEKGSFQTIRDYGKYGCGVKVFPSTAVFAQEEEKPELVYRFWTEEAGEYQVELLTAPANPLVNGESVNLLVRAGDGEPVKARLVPADFRSGDGSDGRWAKAALDKERCTRLAMPFGQGVQELVISPLEAGTVLERIRIYRPDCAGLKSYTGPEESWFWEAESL
ncbi:MAG: hypothetical protein HFH93_03265 [Lachnospiraceae bacterium]|nr:hypothetical protein [Lachnospiraceae bacterium]